MRAPAGTIPCYFYELVISPLAEKLRLPLTAACSFTTAHSTKDPCPRAWGFDELPSTSASAGTHFWGHSKAGPLFLLRFHTTIYNREAKVTVAGEREKFIPLSYRRNPEESSPGRDQDRRLLCGHCVSPALTSTPRSALVPRWWLGFHLSHSISDKRKSASFTSPSWVNNF